MAWRLAGVALAALWLFPAPASSQANPFSWVHTPAGLSIRPNYPFEFLDAESVNGVPDATKFPGTDLGAQINAALLSVPASGGRVEIPCGNYSFSTQILIQKPAILQGQGQCTVLSYTGSGVAILNEMGSGPPYISGRLSDFILDGAAAQAGAVGIEQVDSIGVRYSNVTVQNFSGAGSVGMLWLNISHPAGEPGTGNFNERNYVDHFEFRNNSTSWSLRVSSGGDSSFEYNNVHDAHFEVDDGQTGFLLTGTGGANSLFLGNSIVELMGNVNDPSSPATFISIQNGASWVNGSYTVEAEQTFGSGGFGIVLDASSVFNGLGVLSLGNLKITSPNLLQFGPNNLSDIENNGGTVSVSSRINIQDLYNLGIFALTSNDQWSQTGGDTYKITGAAGEIKFSPSSGVWSVLCAPSGTAGAAITFSQCSAGIAQTIASGPVALPTAAIAAGTCSAAQTPAATGVLATDSMSWSFDSDPGSLTGYSSGLVVQPYVGAGIVGFRVCNPTAGSLTPAAATLNWRVAR